MEELPLEEVKAKIYNIRNQKVMLDSDLAKLYQVETKRINEAVKNNSYKFPSDFIFELTKSEFEILRSKFSTAKFSKTRTLPKVFTKQGVYMLATILKSKIATDVTINIMRTFTKMRQFALNYEEVIKRVEINENETKENKQLIIKAF
jgi:hypothetical protein